VTHSKFELRPVGGVTNQFRILKRYLRLNFLSAVEFKLGIVNIITVVLFNALIWLVYWSVILDATNSHFGSWTSKELIDWYFFTEFSIGFFGLFTGLYSIYIHIIESGLETILSKPVHPIIQIVGTDMYFIALIRSFIAFVILALGMVIFHFRFGLLDLLLGIVVSLMGTLAFAAVYIMVETLSFYLGDIEFLAELVADVEMNFLRLPLFSFGMVSSIFDWLFAISAFRPVVLYSCPGISGQRAFFVVISGFTNNFLDRFSTNRPVICGTSRLVPI